MSTPRIREQQRTPAQLFPLGEFIQEELRARAWTAGILAAMLGEPVEVVNALITGTIPLTPMLAWGLGHAFGTGAEFWLRLQRMGMRDKS